MTHNKHFAIERLPQYVYVFLIYMFIVGFMYFLTYFSVFEFNAIGLVGFIDIIKMAVSSLLNVHVFPYSASMIALRYLIERNDERRFDVRVACLSASKTARQKMTLFFNSYGKEVLIVYILFCLYVFYWTFVDEFRLDDQTHVYIVSMIGFGMAYVISIGLCYLLYMYLEAFRDEPPYIFNCFILLYVVQCGLLSVITAYDDAKNITIGVSYSYKDEDGKSPVECNRFVWMFGETILLWNPSSETIEMSKIGNPIQYKRI